MAQRLANLTYLKPRIWRKHLPLHFTILRDVAKCLQSLNLKPAKKITVRFDPFHKNVQSLRDFLFYTSADKYRETNPKCAFKVEVCNDRAAPVLKVLLENNKELIFKAEHLSIVELFQQFNNNVSSLYIPPSAEPSVELTSKKVKGKLKSKQSK